jgi:hypothetical protein
VPGDCDEQSWECYHSLVTDFDREAFSALQQALLQIVRMDSSSPANVPIVRKSLLLEPDERDWQ